MGNQITLTTNTNPVTAIVRYLQRARNPHSIISEFDKWFDHTCKLVMLEVEADKVQSWFIGTTA